MYAPRGYERVRVAGESGVFLVLWIDQELQEVVLIRLGESNVGEQTVSFSRLEPYTGDGKKK